MRISVFTSLFWLVGLPMLFAQGVTFQQREDLKYDDRISKLEIETARLKEETANAKSNVASLQKNISEVSKTAWDAKSSSDDNKERLGQITWVGRLILGAVAFLIGVIVTQFVSKLMANRQPRRLVKEA
jgi:hypothetical protein